MRIQHPTVPRPISCSENGRIAAPLGLSWRLINIVKTPKTPLPGEYCPTAGWRPPPTGRLWSLTIRSPDVELSDNSAAAKFEHGIAITKSGGPDDHQ